MTQQDAGAATAPAQTTAGAQDAASPVGPAGGAVPAARAAVDGSADPAGVAPASSPLGRVLGWRPTQAVLRWACFAALAANIGIIITGGAVRLTRSGLGCPTWPTCTADSLVPTAKLGINGAVEFSNRMLTFAVTVCVGAAIIACLSRRPRRPFLIKLSWLLFLGVVVQAVIGGISVRTHLAPIWVAIHMVVSLGMVAASYVLWARSGEAHDGPASPTVQPYLRQLGYVLTAVVGALLIAGTVVTGSGPHSGARPTDPHNTRFPITPANATQLHADLVFLAVGLTVALWFALRATGASARIVDTVRDLFLVLMAQGVIGYIQYFTHLPVLLVGLHMVGACIVWVATWRVLLSMRERRAAL
jgi:cytochrome c oxidase assembly protein subunit 15